MKRESIWRDTIMFAKDMKNMTHPVEISEELLDCLLFIVLIMSLQWDETIDKIYTSFIDMVADYMPSYSYYLESIKVKYLFDLILG